jgi:hypothetical protein
MRLGGARYKYLPNKKSKEATNTMDTNWNLIKKLIKAGATEVGYGVDDNGDKLFVDLELDGYHIIVTDDIVGYWINRARTIAKNRPELLK